MTLLRAVVLVGVVVFCGGFIPVGACAKGCGAAGRAASHEGPQIARLGLHATEEVAVTGTRYGMRAGEEIGVTGSRYGMHAGEELGAAGSRYGVHVGDDLARTAEHQAEVAVNTVGVARDVEAAGLHLSESQHDEVIDALLDITEEVMGQLADTSDDDDDQEIEQATVRFDTRLRTTLTPQQLRTFQQQLGSSADVVQRIRREQAAKRASGSAQK